ncbi:serine hydrolase [Actinoplanes sp. LDG1-06]|uniref:Serine hydrolase n=1 Tax=Paractinoplanes ovalisporus TaxID=2810368 RepID=A0ABS2A805_9ACTN|nr:serine hydrolase [Actinoplanes ovalisporus]MBM2615958.1 serine hydrolase [Actinoplanes ovalisporus]
MRLQHVVDEVVAGTPGVRWSISVPGRAEHEPGRRLRTASVGKLLLLIETARQLEDGTLGAGDLLVRDPGVAVADSGLWQHLAVDALPVVDLAVLVAAVSDNWATNVLLGRIGLDAVAKLAAELGLRETGLLDRVRDGRGPDDPPTLSTGAAGELAALMVRISRGELISEAVSARMDGWMATSADLSMVASGFGADPLAHTRSVRNKTGTDDGIRADVGYLGDRAYAVLAEFDHEQPGRTAQVMEGMRAIGAALS